MNDTEKAGRKFHRKTGFSRLGAISGFVASFKFKGPRKQILLLANAPVSGSCV